MPISGLVVTFDATDKQKENLLSLLGSHPCVEVGVASATKCAVALETTSKEADQEAWRWMGELPGVTDIQVAFVGFDDSSEGRPGSEAP